MSNPDKNLSNYQESLPGWNLLSLFEDLAKKKGKPLSNTQERFMCYLLQGKLNKEIAEETGKSEEAVRNLLSTNLYPLLKELLELPTENKIEPRVITPLLIKKGYLKNPIQVVREDTNETCVNIADDLLNRIDRQLRSQTPHRIKQTHYNIIDIKDMTASILNGHLRIEGSWSGQFRDGPLNPGLKFILRKILPNELYSGGDYLNWIDVYGDFYTSFDLIWDEGDRQLRLGRRSVNFGKYNCPKSGMLESIAEAFEKVKIRFSEPLKAFNPLESVDIDRAFTDSCHHVFTFSGIIKPKEYPLYRIQRVSFQSDRFNVTMCQEKKTS